MSSSTALAERSAVDRRAKDFGDPYKTLSSDYIPEDLREALRAAVYYYARNPHYRHSMRRVASYFITDVVFQGEKTGDRTEQQELRDYLLNGLNVFGAMLRLADEAHCYALSFARIAFPFDRSLVDSRSGRLQFWSLDQFPAQYRTFDIQTLTYQVPDPHQSHLPIAARSKVSLPFRDFTSKDPSRISIQSMDPMDIILMPSFFDGRRQVVWDIPKRVRTSIRDGKNMFEIDRTPLEFLRVIRDEQLFAFNEDEVFVFSTPGFSGLSSGGSWQVPEILWHQPALHRLALYHRVDEAVALDYILPLRTIFPNIGGGNNSDQALKMLLSDFPNKMRRMVQDHRRDPTNIQIAPAPIGYQEIGGSGKNLVPKDLIEVQRNTTMEDAGVPVEMFRGSIQVQLVPTLMRLFERPFGYIPLQFNRFLRWTNERVTRYLGREVIPVTLQRPRLADDLEERALMFQLAASGEISRQRAYAGLGVDDPISEIDARMREEMEIERRRAALQREQELFMTSSSINDVTAAQKAQTAGAGGTPPAGNPQAGGVPVSPLQMGDQATQIAQQLLTIPVGERAKELRRIQSSNENLHAMVKQRMEQLRSQAESQGRSQLSQPQQ